MIRREEAGEVLCEGRAGDGMRELITRIRINSLPEEISNENPRVHLDN